MKHHKQTSRTHRNGRAFVVAAFLAVAVALIPTMASGAGTSSKTVGVSNANVVAQCKFTLNKVILTPASAQVQATLTASARGVGFSGLVNNKYTQVYCFLYSDGLDFLTSYTPGNNGSTVNANTGVIVPFYNGYIICAQALVKLANGNNSVTPFACSS
jgi:hypothetical protein